MDSQKSGPWTIASDYQEDGLIEMSVITNKWWAFAHFRTLVGDEFF